MALNAKLGCLKKTERLSSQAYGAGANGVAWREDYQCTMMKFERPEEVSRVDVECPTCGYPLSFEVSSANRVQMKFLVAALVVAAIVLAAGWWVWTTYPRHQIGRPVGLGLLGVGGVGLAMMLLLGLFR
jgi:hypothetical protein